MAEMIDIVAREPSGAVLLVLVEAERDSAATDRLARIEARLNACVEYVESGELARSYPQVKGSPVLIELDWAKDPGQLGRRFVAVAVQALSGRGIGFRARDAPVGA